MRLKNILSDIEEKWIEYGKSVKGNQVGGVYVNPSRKDLVDIDEQNEYRDDIRFVANKNEEEVYVAPGFILHSVIGRVMDYNLDILVMLMFLGIGELKNNKEIEVKQFGDNQRFDKKGERRAESISRDIISGKYDWMGKYHFDMNSVYNLAESKLDRGE